MRTEIHPTYFPDAKIICACGKTYVTGSTEKELHVELCANCHPFYTGKQKLVDTAGRVDKFKKKLETSETKTVAKGKKVKKAAQKIKKASKVKEDKILKSSSTKKKSVK